MSYSKVSIGGGGHITRPRIQQSNDRAGKGAPALMATVASSIDWSLVYGLCMHGESVGWARSASIAI